MADHDSEPDPLPDRAAGPDDAEPKQEATASADRTTGSTKSNADSGNSNAGAGGSGDDAAGHSAAKPSAERDGQPESQAAQQDDPEKEQEEAAAQQQTPRDTTEKRRRADRPTESQLTGAVFNFNAAVNSTGGIGAQVGQPMDAIRRRATGRLADDDVTTTISRYARPDCFDEAVELLRQDRVVVIEGKSGTGRRAGAISLLREVTAGRLVILSPLVTLGELAERKYKDGLGYLVVDRMPDGNSADLDFTWAALRDQVRDGKAYLVVTSAAVAVRAANRAVRHVIWDRPSAAAVLEAQLVGRGYLRDAVDGTVARLVSELPDDCSLARLVELAALVGDGTDPAEALKRLDENAGREVQTWFAENPGHREIVEVTALCFLEGTDVRTFETLLSELKDAAAKRMPGRLAKAVWRDSEPFVDRSARIDGGGLIGFKDVQAGAGMSRVMVFKDEAYRRFVLEQLWQSRSIAFWDAVREWLDAIVAAGDNLPVASGLAWLACASLDEVERSYLDPWSWGRVGWPGQVTSAYVLWYLCHREAMAPVALQTAVRWANGRDVDRRWTALVAFAGDLGVCYPTDAANRIWQLTTQSKELRRSGCTMLACLFATLTEEAPDDANVVLTLLDRKMEKYGVGHGSERMQATDLKRMRQLTMAASLAVLSIAGIRTRRPTIFEYLHTNADRLALVTTIWAGLICYRPFRRDALVALRRGLHSLRDISDDPLAEARAFGAALSEALPADERDPFKTEFMTLDAQLRRGKKESPAEVLLACLEAISQRRDNGGSK